MYLELTGLQLGNISMYVYIMLFIYIYLILLNDFTVQYQLVLRTAVSDRGSLFT